MTSADRTYVGIMRQSTKGTIYATDTNFTYFMFNQGAMDPASNFLQSDDGAGGGPLPNSMEKVGVVSQGAFSQVVRSKIIGHFLTGVLGKCTTTTSGSTAYGLHTITYDTDLFAVPYYTVRLAKGNMWGETFQDVRVASLNFSWRAADFVRATVALVGGTAVSNVTTSSWTPDSKVDRGATFTAPVSTLTTLAGQTLKVLSGAITFQNNIPLEEQWITGSYFPDDFDIVNRSGQINLAVKVTDRTLYEKIQYDPTGSTQAWVAQALKDGQFQVSLKSVSTVTGTSVYQIVFKGDNTAAPNGNIAWSATPIPLRSGGQIIMNIQGTWLGVSSGSPITVELYNNLTNATTYSHF